jgi:DNA transposition AAA+ family ATPase
MTNKAPEQSATGTGVARLTNVGLAMSAMKQIQAAPAQMPRIAVLSGRPGLGKSQAAMYLAHPAGGNAVYLELHSFETTKSLARRLLTELDVRPKASMSINDMYEAACERLSLINRPLVIDEMDHIAETKSVDFIRAIHDSCATPILLIGEQQLQQKLLSHHERFHDRVLVWASAQPCDESDAAALTRHYASALTWEAGTHAALAARANGVARRVTSEIERIREECKRRGLTSVSVEMVGAVVKGAHR